MAKLIPAFTTANFRMHVNETVHHAEPDNSGGPLLPSGIMEEEITTPEKPPDEIIRQLIEEQLSSKSAGENTANQLLEITDNEFTYSTIYPLTGHNVHYKVPYKFNKETGYIEIFWARLVTQTEQFDETSMMHRENPNKNNYEASDPIMMMHRKNPQIEEDNEI